MGRVTIILRTGWHEVGGQSVFVLPDATIGPRGSETVILDGAAHGPYEARGSLKDWQAGVGTLASGHVLPVLAISAALAGPLLHLAGQEGGGLHFHGQSSRGKTTLLQAAASVWGRGGSPGYVRAWRATANGLEGAAASATDTVLILDEFGQVDGREAGAVLYSLSNGGGKVRAARDGAMREPKSWRVMVLSTGEITVDSKLAEDRARKPRAGQLVRMLDIPADRGFGVFDHAGPDDDAGKLAKAFKQAAISAYGVAGPEFVRRLIDEQVTGDDVRGLVGEFVSAHVPAGADGQVDRAAQRLGLIAAAGELATLLGVTPWREGEAAAAAAWALEQWISQRGGTEPAEARQAVEQVRRFIEAHGDYRFEPLDNGDARAVPNRAGWRKGEGPEGNGSFRRRRGEGRFALGLIPNWSRGRSGKPEFCAGRPTASNRCARSAERPSAFSSSGRRSSTGAAMRADLAARLRRTMRGEAIAENGVTGVSGVTATPVLRLKTPAITPVTPVTPRKWQWGKERKRGRILARNRAARGRSRRHRRARGAGGRLRAGLLSRRMGAAQCQRPVERFGSRMATRDR